MAEAAISAKLDATRDAIERRFSRTRVNTSSKKTRAGTERFPRRAQDHETDEGVEFKSETMLVTDGEISGWMKKTV